MPRCFSVYTPIQALVIEAEEPTPLSIIGNVGYLRLQRPVAGFRPDEAFLPARWTLSPSPAVGKVRAGRPSAAALSRCHKRQKSSPWGPGAPSAPSPLTAAGRVPVWR